MISKTKKEFPTLEDLMFRNKSAMSRHKRKKYFEKVKPLKYRISKNVRNR